MSALVRIDPLAQFTISVFENKRFAVPLGSELLQEAEILAGWENIGDLRAAHLSL